jgi:ribosome recycling factor
MSLLRLTCLVAVVTMVLVLPSHQAFAPSHGMSRPTQQKFSYSLYLLSQSPMVLVPSSSSAPSYRHRQQQRQVLHAAATSVKEITDEASERMSKSIESVKLSLTSIRTGRASASILDRVKVDYYGTMTPLNQLASISVPSAQQLSIDPFDKKSTGDIEKAIIEADIGLTPNNDGNIIRINIPPLTEDRRKDLLKQCKQIGEEGKVAIRNVRRDGVDTVKKFEKAGTIGEDEMKDGLDVMQKMTDKCVKEIDEIVAKKEKEVMTV